MTGLTLETILDIILSLSLIVLGWTLLTSRDLFRSVVIFIVFGMLMALVWLRLGAPDIALAEAAIGTGLTAALMLEAVRQLENPRRRDTEDHGRTGKCGNQMVDRRDTTGTVTGSRRWGVLALLLCVLLAGVLVTAGLDIEQLPADGVPPVEENMQAAEVSQPVTAVLLNFRGYDTWLEVGVLIAAVLGLLVLHRAHGLTDLRDEETDPVLDTVTRLLVPLMLLLGGFLLWAGTRIPGGAFQAGAILAGAGVLLRVAGVGSGLGRLMTGWPLRLLAVSGFTLFLIVGAATLVTGRALLEYPAGWAGELIFLLEAGVMISVGWTLAFAYMAATPPVSEPRASDDP